MSSGSEQHPARGVVGSLRERQALCEFVDELRTLLDATATARPPVLGWDRARELVSAASSILASSVVPEERRIYAHAWDVPGRGQVLAPVVVVERRSAERWDATVTFGSFHLGHGGVHGGALPLLFDEVMGDFVSGAGAVVVRTAYLNVTYRAVAPVGIPLAVTVRRQRTDGRKRWVTGEIRSKEGDVLCSAEALFVLARSRSHGRPLTNQ